MELTSDKVINVLRSALEKFYQEDKKYPIISHENGKRERACSYRIAHFLQNEIDKIGLEDKLIVDCEYEIKWNGEKNSPNTGISPDIIIHQRRDGEYVAMIEIKIDKVSDDGDFKKLKNCKRGVGIFLGLYWKGDYVMRVFQNGDIMPEYDNTDTYHVQW
ncbi:MAG: hypothetical protein FWB85_10510 [Chitinispirillia bacterium]|nr:hypothetical protein [Chitinispirillia bacterium]MCL2242614.1 hypothetical protein [Chitinispirillia bacterium]